MPTSTPVPGATTMYVWDINFATTVQRGTHKERIEVRVRRDSSVTPGPDTGDALVNGAAVTLQLFNEAGSPSSLVGTYSGNTNKDGLFRTGLLTLPDGSYRAEVCSLTHSAYVWNRALDPTGADVDADGNNFPDQTHTIPHPATPTP